MRSTSAHFRKLTLGIASVLWLTVAAGAAEVRVVAHGDAEIGFQQISELKPVAGIDIVGPLPDELQRVTVFSAGIAGVSKEPDAGRALIKFLASPAASSAIIQSGLEPITQGGTN
jgi:molybdate transport system substrate-binding protein